MQISSLSSACHYHIRDLQRIRHFIDYSTASTIATTLVHSRLDYCNSLYHALPATQIKRLQQIQNELARTVTRNPKHSRMTTALKSLHRLKIEQRIQSKILSITHNLLHKSQPSYIASLSISNPLPKLDHPMTSVSLFRHTHPRSNSPIALSKTLLRVFGTIFP